MQCALVRFPDGELDGLDRLDFHCVSGVVGADACLMLCCRHDAAACYALRMW